MCASHRKWPQDMTPSCGLHSWAVDLSSRSLKKWRNQDQDTPANQNSSDTSMDMYEYEWSVTVPTDVRACSFIWGTGTSGNARTWQFLNNAMLWITCLQQTKEREYPSPIPITFSQRIYTVWKYDLWEGWYGFTRFGNMTSEKADTDLHGLEIWLIIRNSVFWQSKGIISNSPFR